MSNVGLDEELIRKYIQNKELEEKRQEQMRLAPGDHHTTRSTGGMMVFG